MERLARIAHFASVIDREVVRRHQRGLILVGGAHISRKVQFQEADEPLVSVRKEPLRDRGLRLLVKAFADQAELDTEALSTQRAALVLDWLAARGVQRKRLIPREVVVRCVRSIREHRHRPCDEPSRGIGAGDTHGRV
jgi:hypothetical protein